VCKNQDSSQGGFEMLRFDSLSLHGVSKIEISEEKKVENAVYHQITISFPDGSTTCVICHGKDVEVQVEPL